MPFTGPGQTCFAAPFKGHLIAKEISAGLSVMVVCMLLQSLTFNYLSPAWLVIIRLREVGGSFFISDIMTQTMGYRELPIKQNCRSQSITVYWQKLRALSINAHNSNSSPA